MNSQQLAQLKGMTKKEIAMKYWRKINNGITKEQYLWLCSQGKSEHDESNEIVEMLIKEFGGREI